VALVQAALAWGQELGLAQVRALAPEQARVQVQARV
jgi:hypothetical protein